MPMSPRNKIEIIGLIEGKKAFSFEKNRFYWVVVIYLYHTSPDNSDYNSNYSLRKYYRKRNLSEINNNNERACELVSPVSELNLSISFALINHVSTSSTPSTGSSKTKGATNEHYTERTKLLTRAKLCTYVIFFVRKEKTNKHLESNERKKFFRK